MSSVAFQTMRVQTLRRAMACAAGILLPLVCAVPALAKTVFAAKVADYCKSSESCAICHGRPNEKATIADLNVFGREFQKALIKAQNEKAADPVIAALQAVAAGDSDGDGATNFEEISLGTNPGEADSKPAPEKLAEFRKTHAVLTSPRGN
jgi:hypothetical protein